MKRLYIGDALIVGCVLLLCLAAQIFLFRGGAKASKTVVVRVDGKPYNTYALDSDTDESIGSTGVRLVISDGKAYIAESDCSDKTCIHSGALTESAGQKVIVCLPNRVSVSLADADGDISHLGETEVDSVAG